MITAATVLGVLVLLLLTGAISYSVGNRKAKVALEFFEEEKFALEYHRKHDEHIRDHIRQAHEHYRYWRQRVSVVEAERDKYAEIARSHTITLPQKKSNDALEQIWNKRFFSATIEDNLAAMTTELTPYLECQGIMEVMIHGDALNKAWGGIIKKSGWIDRDPYGNTTPTANIGPLRYEGPCKQMLREFETFLRDDNTGLVKKADVEGGFAWKDGAPIRFQVTLKVQDPPEPQIQIIQVPVAVTEQKVLSEVVVEVPVFLLEAPPETKEPSPPVPVPDLEKLVSHLVSEALARKEAEQEVEQASRRMDQALRHREAAR